MPTDTMAGYIKALLDGCSCCTPPMAIRIQKAFSVKIEQLTAMQTSFDTAGVWQWAFEFKMAPFKQKMARVQSGDMDEKFWINHTLEEAAHSWWGDWN